MSTQHSEADRQCAKSREINDRAMANIKVSQAVDRRTAANDEMSQAVDRRTAASVVSTEMLQAVYRQTAANADEPENVFTEERHGQHKSYTFATEKKTHPPSQAFFPLLLHDYTYPFSPPECPSQPDEVSFRPRHLRISRATQNSPQSI